MKYDIFISYRREGGYDTAKHLNDLLVRDGYKVSFDIDTLRNGDFDVQLLTRIEQCKDFILIVDSHAFDRTLDPSFDPQKDWMRCELAHALRHKKNIIPVFLSGVSNFPIGLPDDISAVALKNGPKYDKYYFNDFYRQLRTRFLKSKNHKKWRLWLLGFSVVIVGLFLFMGLNAEEERFYIDPFAPLPSDSARFCEFADGVINANIPTQVYLSDDSVAVWNYWYNRTNEGDCDGELKLGLCYFLGYGCEENDDKAFYYISKSAKQDNDTAIYALGAMYYYGFGVKEDVDKAIENYKLAAERGMPEAQTDYGITFAMLGNMNEAVLWLRKAVEQNYVPAKYAIAYILGSSYTVNDLFEGLNMMESAAKDGYRLAKLSLINVYLQGSAHFRDIDKGIELLFDLLDEYPNDPMAKYMMAMCYFQGLGVEIDMERANELLTSSAELGYNVAMLDLGIAYCTGNVYFQQDYTKAMEYFQKAAAQGNPVAQLWIGRMYENGWGVKKSNMKAAKWYNKAARQNVTWQTVQSFYQEQQKQNLNSLSN